MTIEWRFLKMISTPIVASSNTVLIMIHLVLYRAVCVSCCMFLFLYRKEVCIILSCVCVTCLMWFIFRAYKYVSFFLRFVPFCKSSIVQFKYPPSETSDLKIINKPKRQSVGNVTFDALDTIAQCLQVEFKTNKTVSQ